MSSNYFVSTVIRHFFSHFSMFYLKCPINQVAQRFNFINFNRNIMFVTIFISIIQTVTLLLPKMASHLWICMSCGQYLKGIPQKVLEFGETHICEDIQINEQTRKGITDITTLVDTLFEKKEVIVNKIASASASVTPSAHSQTQSMTM